MYRDDPLDDEAELRDLLGDGPVDRIVEAGDELDGEPLLVAMDALRLLQGWVDEERAAAWFSLQQRRLADGTPVDALVRGDFDDVLDSARAWAAAQG